jgi:hypothetical protein
MSRQVKARADHTDMDDTLTITILSANTQNLFDIFLIYSDMSSKTMNKPAIQPKPNTQIEAQLREPPAYNQPHGNPTFVYIWTPIHDSGSRILCTVETNSPS